MNHKPGFSALELMMVMAVSAIIMTSLFEIYNQVVRNVGRVERFVMQDSKILTLEYRLYQDVMGMSAIWFTQADFEKKQTDQNVSDPKSSEKDQKKTSQYFYSMNKNNNLAMLTFVTTSALQSYGTTQDRYVRVVYKLEDDVLHPGTLRLMRKEITAVSEYIDDKTLEQGKFYELANNIGSLQMNYQLIDVVELKKQEQAKKDKNNPQSSGSQAAQNKPIIRSVKEWKEDITKNNEQKNKKEQDSSDEDKSIDLGGAVVPKIIEMKISFGLPDDPAKKEYTLAFFIPSSLENYAQGSKQSPKTV